MIATMLTVIGGWILTFCVLAGLGQFVRRAFGIIQVQVPRSATAGGWFSAFWIGYAVVISVLEIWHLLLPIDWRICVILSVIGLIGFAWANMLRRLSSASHVRITAISRRTFAWHWLQIGLQTAAMIPIALWIASRALNAQVEFDTAMYHLSTIHWLNVYPVVPGIGNLHYRLAFNQSFFMFVAALNVYPFFGQGMHLANSLLLIVLIAQVVNTSVATLCFEPASRRTLPYSLLSAFMLPILLYRATYQPDSANMSSPSPDLSIFVFQIVVILAFNRLLFTGQLSENERKFTLFFIVALSAVGITSKLSFVAFGLGTVGLTLLNWLRAQRGQWQIRAGRQALTGLIVVGVCLILPWIGNGLIGSGYPLFPSTFGALPVDYRVPAAIAADAADWVRSFARDPHGDIQKVLSGWDWIPIWESSLSDSLKHFLFVQPFHLFEVALVVYIILFVIILLVRRRYRFRVWQPLAPAILSALFWFWSAPDPRFAGAAFWIMALWGFVLIFTLLPKSRWVVYSALIPAMGMAAVVVINGLNSDFRTDDVGFPRLPTVPITQFETRSGLRINVAGNPNDTLELWDAPLPASPYRLPDLELRGTDLKDGFRMATPPS